MYFENQSAASIQKLGNDETTQEPMQRSNRPNSQAVLQPIQVEVYNASVFKNLQIKNKGITKRRKKYIALGVFLAICMIIGGVVTYEVLSEQNNGPQIPKTYSQYQKIIQANQENNLAEIIHVPQGQKIYDYTLVNDQVTIQSADVQSNTKSTVTHQFGLVCIDVTELSFDMILYFIDSKITGDSKKDVSTLTGYPAIKEISKRLLRQTESTSTDDNSEKIANEYGFLNQKEIKILKSLNISVDQFYSSNLPLIRFSITKQGSITSIQQPINIRYDIHQIYLNILEQISPIILKDFYSISNGKRLLSSSTQKFTQRIISNEVVEPKYTAEVKQNGNISVEKSYEILKQKNDGQTQTYQDYTQKANIKNGAIESTQVNSKFSLEDTKIDKNDNSQPLFSKLLLNSTCAITFVKQQDIMNKNFFKNIIQDQENMTIIEFTWEQAIDAYNQVFNVQKQTSSFQQNEDSRTVRLLQQSKLFNKSVTKPIFRKTYASMDFGADIQSSCYDQVSGGDICNVGLYSYFNGDSIKLIEKNTTINVSQILKIYHYIHNILNDKIFAAAGNIQQNINAVSNTLDDIITKVESTIDINQNPVLKQIKTIVEGDSLNIIAQIKQIESFIQLSLNSINKIFQDPLDTLKNRTLSYIQAKNSAIYIQIQQIQNFYSDKYAQIQDFITQANQNGGLSSNIKQQVQFLLNHHTSVIITLIEQPVKNAMDQISQSIIDSSDNFFQNSTLVDQFINQNINSLVQNLINNSTLSNINLPFNVSGFNITDQLSTIINQISGNPQVQSVVSNLVQQVANNTDIINQLKNGLQQTLDTIENTIISQINSLQTKDNSTTADDQNNIDKIQAELDSVLAFGTDFYQDIVDVKNNITNISQQISNLKSSDVKNIAIDLSINLLNLPVEVAIKIKDDANAIVNQLKQIGISVYNELISWKNDLVNDSQVLLTQAQVVYSQVLSFLNNTTYPSDDPKFYQKPLYDDILSSITNVRNIMNITFQNVTNKYQRLKNIPQKYQQFVADLQTLYQSTLSFAKQIKITIISPNIDTGLIGQYVTQMVSGSQQQSEQNVISSIQSDVKQPVALMASPALSLQLDQLVNVDLLQTYNVVVSNQELNVQQIYKQLMINLLASSNINQTFSLPKISIPVQYIFVYPTPIGVGIQLKLSATWNTDFGFGIGIKNANLDLNATISTNVAISGSVSASVIVAEVGGYAQGTFLDASVIVGVHLEVLNSFKGTYFFDATFNPYNVTVGIYYQYYFPTNLTTCLNSNSAASSSDSIKSNVQTIISQISSIVAKFVSVVSCITTQTITLVRNDLFDPYSVQGNTYSVRLAEGSF